MDDGRMLAVFLDVQRGLPRQGPGCKASTLEALALCEGLPERPRVLDVGCGPGMQTLVLARATGGRIVAVDLLGEYLAQLDASARAEGLRDRVDPVRADMTALPFGPGRFDLVWAEGSAYSMGIAEALATWRPLLAPGGWLAFTELCWLTPDPPAEVVAFFAEEYPAMADVATIEGRVRAAGHEPAAPFTVPDAGWWDDYYRPLDAKLPALRERYADDPDALAVVEGTAREIDVRRRYPEAYGYVFFVGRRAG